MTYETDLDAVLDLLPEDVSPSMDPPRVTAYFGTYEFTMGGGPYEDMAPLLHVQYDGDEYLWSPVVFQGEGTEEWFAAGREVLGAPKKLARLQFHERFGTGLVMATVERPFGHRLVTMILGPFGVQGDAADFEFRPVLAMRVFPHAEESRPGTAELISKEVTATIRKAEDGSAMIFEGPATVEYARSEQDPIYKLAPNRIISGHYVQFGTIGQFQGKVLKRYEL